MKKKFDWKLAICVVSLFIGICLIAFLYENKTGRFWGLFLIAVSVFAFAWLRAKNMDKVIELTQIDIDAELEKQDKDTEFLTEVYKEFNKYKKQKQSMLVSFTLFSALMFILAIASLF